MFGILDTEDTEVPGTIYFESDAETASGLKRHPKRSDVVLQPQPSNDVNDPLNWSRWRKEAYYISILIGTAVVGAIGPIVIPAPPQIVPEFKISVKEFIALIGDLVLTYGISSYFVVCLSDTLGRRGICLLSHVLMLGGIIWAGLAQTYGQLVGARVLQGFSMGVYGCLASSFINDVFFLHGQGTRMAIWQFSFNGVIAIAPILSGQICEHKGWRYMFWILLPFECLALIIAVLFQPESVYDRQPFTTVVTALTVVEDLPPREDKDQSSPAPTFGAAPEKDMSTADPVPVDGEHGDLVGTPHTWSTLMRPWSGWHGPKRSIAAMLIRPFCLWASPGVVYATVLFTFTFSWFPMLGSLYSAVYSAPPYNFNSASVGYVTGVSPLIGVMFALVLSGPMLDRSAAYLSKRNQGLFEPEFRLIANIPAFICFAIGAFGWTWSISKGQHYIVTAVYLAFLAAGASFGTIGSISYAMALFPSRSGDAFGLIMLTKGFYAWSTTLYLAGYFASAGPWHWGLTQGGITLFIIALGVPFWIWGKRARSWVTKFQRLRWIFVDE